MRLKGKTGIMTILLFVMCIALISNARTVEANVTIYIRADGSIDPSTAPIASIDNFTYIITNDIIGGIVVQRSDIIVNGNGHTLNSSGVAPWEGFYLSNVNNITIQNTNIEYFRDGIYIVYSSNNTITGNNITNNYRGIAFGYTSGNTIIGNNIAAQMDYGITLHESYGTIITGNNVTANKGSGIRLSYSSGNSITGNNLANNSGGIWLEIAVSNNIVFHNNFFENNPQVSVYDLANVWDNGYPSGGNYWSDYIGVDFYSGPYQNITGNDGIDDTPYTIDANNRDQYPLMNPYGSPPSPQPQIVEPSILDPEAPRHNDTLLVGGDFINVSAVELAYAEDIENTTFEYSSDGLNWNLIGVSFEGIKEYENLTDIDGDPINIFRLWTVTWDTRVVNEGLYCVKATMIDAAGQSGEDNITIYFDRVPPIPEPTIPWETTVKGTIQFSVETNATDVSNMTVETTPCSDSPKTPKSCNVPYHDTGGSKCIWDAMAALLYYWANLPGKKGDYPLHKLIEGANGGEGLLPEDLVKALIDEYKNHLDKTNPDDPRWKTNPKKGLEYPEDTNVLWYWLKLKGFIPGDYLHDFAPGYAGGIAARDVTFAELKQEFEQLKGTGCPLMVTISYKKPGIAHEMIVTSMNNDPLTVDENGKPLTVDPKHPENNQYEITFMDPNRKGSRKTRIRGDGKILMDWNQDRILDPKNMNGNHLCPDGWWNFPEKTFILPPKAILEQLDLLASWVPQGIDKNGTDGWYCALDTTNLPEGYNFVRATMVDLSGNKATAITEVFVDNIPELKGDINGDGTVDIFDAILLADVYGKQEDQEGWNPYANLNMTPDQLTGKQVIDIFDAIMLGNNYGRTA